MKLAENLKQKKTYSIYSRIFYFPLVQILIAVIFINVSTFIIRNITQSLLTMLSISDDVVVALLIFVVRVLTVYYAYLFFVKAFEKRNAEELSINFKSMKQLSYGVLFGLLSISAIMFSMWLSGNFTILGINDSATLFHSFLHNFFFAFLQDVIYFAVIFRIIEKSLGSITAIMIASFIFGFKHLLFPGYTLWSVIAQSIEGGILFCTLFIFSRNIWLIFGFHLAWNFIQYGLILGFKSEELISLFNSKFSGSNLITGMPVGLEASLLTFFILTSIGIYLLFKVYKKGDFIYPFWKGQQN